MEFGVLKQQIWGWVSVCLIRQILSHKESGEGNLWGSAISALHAEVLACIQALHWAHQNQLQDVNLFIDSTNNLVHVMQNNLRPHTELIWNFDKIRVFANTFTSCCITKVPRKEVADADKIAK